MYGFDTMAKMIKVLVSSHPNPSAVLQKLYDNSTDEREKKEIDVLAWGLGITIAVEEDK